MCFSVSLRCLLCKKNEKKCYHLVIYFYLCIAFLRQLIISRLSGMRIVLQNNRSDKVLRKKKTFNLLWVYP